MPLIYEPKPKHECLEDHKFDAGINRYDIPEGTIWQCPTCERYLLREMLYPRYSQPRLGWVYISERKKNKLLRKYQEGHR